jgi:hypothetical protein
MVIAPLKLLAGKETKSSIPSKDKDNADDDSETTASERAIPALSSSIMFRVAVVWLPNV